MLEIEELYVKKLNLTPLVDKGPNRNRFGISSFFSEESAFEGGLYQHLYRNYFLLDIYKVMGVNFNDWMKQPFYKINRQIKQIPNLLQEKAEIIEKHNEDLNN